MFSVNFKLSVKLVKNIICNIFIIFFLKKNYNLKISIIITFDS